MRKVLSFKILIIVLIHSSFAQTKTSYHEYYQNASDYFIVRWNIPQDSLNFVESYIEELTDNQNRVLKLKFLEKGELFKDRLCYLPDFVEYNYPDDRTIIETLYNADGSKMNGLDCEGYYKTTYKLNDSFIIESAQIEYFIDTVKVNRNLTSEDIKTEMDYINKNMVDSSSNILASYFVRYYLMSYSKYNRKFPVNKNFTFVWDENNQENIDVRKCLISEKRKK